MRFLMVVLFLAGPVWADGERAGEFDYYVLSLSWSPNFCDRINDPDHPQCDPGKDYGWVLHGLWPQYEKGWPSFCRTSERNPSRADTAAEAPLYGSSGSAWHQWKKHGTCSGLSAEAYYDLAEQAYGSVILPEILRRVEKPIRLPASLIEEAFLESNPFMAADQITITCKSNQIQEARVCMTKNLGFRRCGADVIRDCTQQNAEFNPIQ